MLVLGMCLSVSSSVFVLRVCLWVSYECIGVCLSSAIVLMCLCHLCLPFCHLCVICVCHFAISVSFVCLPFCHLCVICVSAFCHLCVICVLCDVFCFCSTESRDGFFSKQKAFCQCS